MNKQDGTQSPKKQRRSRKINTVNQQNGKQASVTQRPAHDDKEGWKVYWQAQGQPWRTEPEIDAARQKYLDDRRSIKPDIEQGIYPFKDIQLSRADVEWLLSTHDNGHGPVDWHDESQRGRDGLDLRGADLQKVNLRGLPLACLIGGLTGSAWFYASPEQCEMAAVRMQGALLIETELAGAKLNQAYLERANLFRSNLEKAELRAASLKQAYLNETCLGGSLFRRAHLEGVWLTRAHLEGISTPPADLSGAFFDSTSNLKEITLGNKEYGYVQLADVSWGGVNLSRIDWSKVKELGDERKARQLKDENGEEKDKETQIIEYQTAIRANRQLSVALQKQGLYEEANDFTYHAQVMQRQIYRLEALQHINRQKNRGRRWIPLLLFIYSQIVVLGLAAAIFINQHSINHGLISAFWQGSVPLELLFVGLLVLIYLPPILLKLEKPQQKEKFTRTPLLLVFLILSFLVLCLFPVVYFPPLLLSLPGFLLDTGFVWLVIPILGLIFLLSRIPILKRVRATLIFLIVSLLVWLVFLASFMQGFPTLMNLVLAYFPWLFLEVWLIPSGILSISQSLLRFLLSHSSPKKPERPLLNISKKSLFKAVSDYGRYTFSLFLDLLAGYGYKPSRSVIGYLLVILGFASAYYLFHPIWHEALIFSVTSFHGRGFFPGGNTSLSDPKVILAAIEAVIGLFIEISFIATFTQRFFGR